MKFGALLLTAALCLFLAAPSLSLSSSASRSSATSSSSAASSASSSSLAAGSRAKIDILTDNFGIMIDAGSSGTRIHVYRWPQRAAPLVYSSSLQISELALDTTRSETPEGHGLSSFVDAPAKAGESLKPLLRYILRDTELSRIPERISSIPIYLKATAGMRVLPSSIVTAIMSSVRSTLAASGFLFEPLNARVISGEEEGVFGWLGINFLMGTLDGSLNETIGCMDMGGASTQLTVAPHEEVLSSFFPLYVHHSFLPLYTHSLLYFGLNEFHKRVKSSLVQKVDPLASSLLIEHPCFHKGYTSDQFTSSSGRVIRFAGTSDFTACTNIQRPLLQMDHSVNPCFYPTACSVEGAYLPSLDKMRFVAFSNFASVFRGFFRAQESVSLRQLYSAVSKMCRMSWAEVNEAFGRDNVSSSHLHSHCASGSYMLLLLTEAYHLPLDSSSIRFASDFGDGGSQIALSWTLGALMYEENLLPWSGSAETGGRAGGHSTFDFLSILVAGALGGFACATCAFFVFAAHRSRAPPRFDRERPHDAQLDESEMAPIRAPAGADSATITVPYRVRSV